MLKLNEQPDTQNVSASDLYLHLICRNLETILNDALMGREDHIDTFTDEIARYANCFEHYRVQERRDAVCAALDWQAEWLASEVYTANGSDYYHGFRVAALEADVLVDMAIFTANGYEVVATHVINGVITFWVKE